MIPGLFDASNINAPAPSPNNIHVDLSDQSIILLIVSVPMINIRLNSPDFM